MENLEKQKIVEAEMEKLVAQKGKRILLQKIYSGKIFELDVLLVDISPYIDIITINQTSMKSHTPFIGLFSGILKISEKETGAVLYENVDLTVPNSIKVRSKEARILMNKSREEKYGTAKYNMKSLYD